MSQTTATARSLAPVGELCGVTKRFGTTEALRDVDLALAPGQLTALLGPNGAGKTTAVRLLLGLARPTAGEVRLFGRSPLERAARVRVGVMLQVSGVPETLRVREHVHLFSSYYPEPLSVDEALAMAGVVDLADRRFGDLSGGERQRVLFAIAVCGNPDLFFLDEPTVGLDVESRRLFWHGIRRLLGEGRSVLLTTHYLEEADALADRVVVLNEGRVIADGTPASIKQQTADRRIRCVTLLGHAALAALPGVQTVERDREAVVLVTTAAEATTRRLLALDEGVSRLEITNLRLEDAFLALTARGASSTGRVSA